MGVDGIACGIANLVRIIRQRIKIVYSRFIKNAQQYLTPLLWHSGCAPHSVLASFLPALSIPTVYPYRPARLFPSVSGQCW